MKPWKAVILDVSAPYLTDKGRSELLKDIKSRVPDDGQTKVSIDPVTVQRRSESGLSEENGLYVHVEGLASDKAKSLIADIEDRTQHQVQAA